MAQQTKATLTMSVPAQQAAGMMVKNDWPLVDGHEFSHMEYASKKLAILHYRAVEVESVKAHRRGTRRESAEQRNARLAQRLIWQRRLAGGVAVASVVLTAIASIAG